MVQVHIAPNLELEATEPPQVAHYPRKGSLPFQYRLQTSRPKTKRSKGMVDGRAVRLGVEQP